MKTLISAATAFIVLVSSVALVTAQGNVSETGKTGMSFLSVTPSARSAALGGLTSTLQSGASSVWSNPSLIARQTVRSAQFTHTEWVDGIKQEYATASIPSQYGNFGIGMQLFDSGDIELRGNAPSSEPLGAYSIKNVAIGLSFARAITDYIAAGLTYKTLLEKISDENASGFAIDAGVHVTTPWNGIALSATARNYGRMSKLKSERTELPSDISVGALYSGEITGLVRSYNALADIVVPKYGDTGIRIGVEVLPVESFSFRIGYRSDSDIESISFGIGFAMDRVSGDVSYTPMKEGFDSALRFMLSLTGF